MIADGMLSVRELHNSNRFSDLTIVHGDRKIPAHRFVLSEKSGYFRKLLEASVGAVNALPVHHTDFRQVDESGHSECKLDEDDDVDAIDSMLAYIYGSIKRKRKNWLACFNLFVVALKYEVDDLKSDALGAMCIEARKGKPGTTVEVLQALSAYHDNVLAMSHARRLIKDEFMELVQAPEYLAWLAKHPEMAIHHVKQMGTMLKEITCLAKAYDDTQDLKTRGERRACPNPITEIMVQETLRKAASNWN
ncbi:hypothetical protein LTS10_011165 [Elasticomyces elasticus]|nr:hypothetical protein LTS10_011165 [Elasticomyces elasticus]